MSNLRDVLSDGSPDLLLAEAMIEGLPYRLFFPAKGKRLNFSLTAIRISALFFSKEFCFIFLTLLIAASLLPLRRRNR